MLPRSQRLSRTAFEEVSRGELVHSRFISLRTNTRSEKQGFSFVISKKVAAKAVDRNLLKRRASGVVQHLLGKRAMPFSGIFFFKKGSAGLSYEELEKEIRSLLNC